MLDKKKIGIMLVITFIVVASYTYYCCTNEWITNYESPEAGLEVFYHLENVGISLTNYIFITFMATNFYLMVLFKNKKNKTREMIIERIGYKKTILEEIKNIIITSSLFRLTCFLAMLFIISIICHGIHFKFLPEMKLWNWQFYFYSDNALISFIIYILIAIVGYSMFCLLLYCLSHFIKNEFVYRVSGVIMGILGQTGLAIVASFFGTNASTFFDYLLVNTVFVGNLLCPGSCEIGSKPEQISYYIPIILALAFFGWVIYKLLRYIYRKEYKEGS